MIQVHPDRYRYICVCISFQLSDELRTCCVAIRQSGALASKIQMVLPLFEVNEILAHLTKDPWCLGKTNPLTSGCLLQHVTLSHLPEAKGSLLVLKTREPSKGHSSKSLTRRISLGLACVQAFSVRSSARCKIFRSGSSGLMGFFRQGWSFNR